MSDPLRLAIFDVDGTLLDSQDVIVGAMDRAFRSHDLPPPTSTETKRIVGLELYEAVARLAPDLDEALIKSVGDAYKNAFIENRKTGGGEAEAPLYAGAVAALERLHATAALMGVATGKARRGLDHTLDAHDLRRFFVTTQTCTENPGKPNPAMVENCLRETGAEARDTIMIGDTVFDMEMGKNAGAWSLGVAWGYHEVEELRDAGADLIIGAFDELHEALDELWRRA
ncbi:MAG: HAD-IA family hydrolase [Pseudomonadota bacterium]